MSNQLAIHWRDGDGEVYCKGSEIQNSIQRIWEVRLGVITAVAMSNSSSVFIFYFYFIYKVFVIYINNFVSSYFQFFLGAPNKYPISCASKP